MTKEEFRLKWDGGEDGGGITWDDIAECAISWGLFSKPRTRRLDVVANAVTKAAGCKDIYQIIPVDAEVVIE